MILLKWFLLNTKSKYLQHPPFTSIKSKSLLLLMCAELVILFCGGYN